MNDDKIALPALLDVVQPNDAKICPIMGSQVFVMPISAGSVLAAGQPQQAFVRHYNPCVREKCQLWITYEDPNFVKVQRDVVISNGRCGMMSK